MDEKLKEFVEHELSENSYYVQLGEGGLREFIQALAQAVAAFTEERVLEGLRETMPFNKNICHSCYDRLEIIDQRIAELKAQAGKETKT